MKLIVFLVHFTVLAMYMLDLYVMCFYYFASQWDGGGHKHSGQLSVAGHQLQTMPQLQVSHPEKRRL